MLLCQSLISQTLFYFYNLSMYRINCSSTAVLMVGNIQHVIYITGDTVCMQTHTNKIKNPNGPDALTTEYFVLCLEILPDNQPHVGHGKCREMGGRSPGKAFCVCVCMRVPVCWPLNTSLP